MHSTGKRWLPALLALTAAAGLLSSQPLRAQEKAEGPGASTPSPDLARVEMLNQLLLEAIKKGEHEKALGIIESLRALVVAEKRAAEAKPETREAAAFTPATSPLPLTVADRKLQIHFGSSTIYAVKGGTYERIARSKYVVPSGLQLAVEDRGRLAIENRYIKVGEDTRTLEYSSSNPKVLRVSEKGRLEVVSPGTAEITVTAGDARTRVPFQVVLVPGSAGASPDDLIKELGIPDRKVKRYIPWPETGYVDGIFYGTRSDATGNSVHHWHYKRYPGAILQFDILDKLVGCEQTGWTSMHLLVYKLDH